MSETKEILFEVKDRVATITINRPKRRNAMNPDVMAGLKDSFEKAGADPKVSAIVLAGAGGTKQFGGTRRAVVGAVIGSIVGLFFGIIGIIVGPFLGAVIAELTGRRSLKDATRAGVGTSWGLVLGVAAKLAIVFAMVGIFITVRFL